MSHNITAVILAGGMGKRLLPITCTIPKPLAPVLGDSVLRHIVNQLSGAGIKKASLTTMYLPEKIKDELGDEFVGTKLAYFHEDKPKGTAGGVKIAADGTSRDILVISGDGISDFNFKAIIDFHRQKDADVTIVTYRNNNPLEYGVVCSHEDGSIYEFREKPPWAQVSSNQINTGIYILKNDILDYIPDDGAFDFSKDLFPKLMEMGKKLYAFEAVGFWCDIGDLDEYYKCNMKSLDGEIKGIESPVGYTKTELELLGCRVKEPFWVSKGAIVSSDVTIGPYTIIGKGCFIQEDSKIEYSILHENISVGIKTKIQSAIVCDRVKIADKCLIKEGSVIGSDCEIGSGTVLKERTRLFAGEKLYMVNETSFGEKGCGLFCNDGIDIGILTSDGASKCSKIGSAFARTIIKSLNENDFSGRIGVMHDGSDRSELVGQSLLCGIQSAGIRAYHFGSGFLSMAHFAAVSFITDLVLYVATDDMGRCTIRPINRLSLPVSRTFERMFEGIYSENTEVIPNVIYDVEYFDGLRFLYYSDLLKNAKETLRGMSLQGVKFCVSEQGHGYAFSPSHILKRAAKELSAEISDEPEDTIHIILSPDGTEAEIYDNVKDIKLDQFHINAILLYDKAQNGTENIALPYLSPEIYRTIVKQAKCSVSDYLYYSNKENQIPRNLMYSQIWMNDGVFSSLRILGLMKKRGKDLSELLSEIPKFEVYRSEFDPQDTDRAQVMSELSKNQKYTPSKGEKEGIRLAFPGGRVTVVPNRQSGFRLISEAESYEMAKELCFEAMEQLKEIK